jgi:hypothetical protein
MSETKTFTLAEAQNLLPVVEGLLNRAIDGKDKAQAIEREMQALHQRIFLAGGMQVDVVAAARQRAEQTAAVRRAQDAVSELDAIGVQVKDLDKGLLDFPCLLDGEIVLLCWKLGEPEIAHWHTIESGFGGRQPIDDRFTQSKKKRPN